MLVSSLLVAMTLTAGEGDRLNVERGSFADSEAATYELAVARALLPDACWQVQLVTLPSFEAESAVYITCPDFGPLQVVSRRLKKSLWDGFAQRLGASRNAGASIPAAELDAFRLPAPEVSVATAPISAATLARLKEVWTAALLAARQPAPHGLGADGVTYHFADWAQGAGMRTGWCWSPAEGSTLHALVQLGAELEEYVRAPQERRRALDEALREHASALLPRLTSRR